MSARRKRVRPDHGDRRGAGTGSRLLMDGFVRCSDRRGPAMSSKGRLPDCWRASADGRAGTSRLILRDEAARRGWYRPGRGAFMGAAIRGIRASCRGVGHDPCLPRRTLLTRAVHCLRLASPAAPEASLMAVWPGDGCASPDWPQLRRQTFFPWAYAHSSRGKKVRLGSPPRSLRAKLRRHAHPAFGRHRGRMGRPENERLRTWQTSAASRRSARNIRVRS